MIGEYSDAKSPKANVHDADLYMNQGQRVYLSVKAVGWFWNWLGALVGRAWGSAMTCPPWLGQSLNFKASQLFTLSFAHDNYQNFIELIRTILLCMWLCVCLLRVNEIHKVHKEKSLDLLSNMSCRIVRYQSWLRTQGIPTQVALLPKHPASIIFKTPGAKSVKSLRYKLKSVAVEKNTDLYRLFKFTFLTSLALQLYFNTMLQVSF